MKKKLLLLVMLALLLTGGLFAQSNWVYGQVGLLNGGLGYERILNKNFGVGGEVYYNSLFFFWNSFVVEAYAKYYFFGVPGFWGKVGLGYGTVTGTEDVKVGGSTYSWFYSTSGFVINPEVGWKIDVGKKGAFFLEPKLGGVIVLGTKDYDLGWGQTYDENGKFKVGFNFTIALGLGYAF